MAFASGSNTKAPSLLITGWTHWLMAASVLGKSTSKYVRAWELESWHIRLYRQTGSRRKRGASTRVSPSSDRAEKVLTRSQTIRGAEELSIPQIFSTTSTRAQASRSTGNPSIIWRGLKPTAHSGSVGSMITTFSASPGTRCASWASLISRC